MKKFTIFALSAALVFLLASCSEPCQTQECWDAKAKYEREKSETAQKEADAEHRRFIERQKAKAEIEASKPESVRLQEVKNEETTVGEGIDTAVKVGAGVYILGKFLDVASK
jgi:PBP1b-binding outer membrane lipoprotein LpoB